MFEEIFVTVLKVITGIVIPAIIAVSLHEVAHGYIAYLQGDNTAKNLGRLTLNPIAHIDPFGTIILPAAFFFLSGFLFGYAKPVPVNPFAFKNPKNDMAMVALAGPVTNILLAIVASLGYKSIIYFYPDLVEPFYKYIAGGSEIESAHFIPLLLLSFLYGSIVINIILAIINMIPIPPADGSRVIAKFISDELYMKYLRLEPFGMFILIFLFVFNPLHIMDYTLRPLITLLLYMLL